MARKKQTPTYEPGTPDYAYPARTKPQIQGPEDVLKVCEPLLTADREHFIVLLLNARHEVQERLTIGIGSANACLVHPREVFRPAIIRSSVSIVCVHNHPSGDTQPSAEDLTITRRLISAGELLGIATLDHIIIGKGNRKAYSMRAQRAGGF